MSVRFSRERETDPGVSYPSIRRGNAPVSQFADPDYRGRPIRIVRVKNIQVGNLHAYTPV
ncbi:MAG: hypothetical protein WDZ91_06980 [Paenibacillaceae bacterium]